MSKQIHIIVFLHLRGFVIILLPNYCKLVEHYLHTPQLDTKYIFKFSYGTPSKAKEINM